jgi:hypothetical protein
MSTKLAADAAQGGKVSMTGLNTASLQARETFLRTADASNQQMDALSLLANAAGKGQQGVNMLQRANKDMVASMLPAAKGSQALTDVLYALAQRGGYGGADSFKALSSWVGKTKDPMHDLDKITTTLTTDAANLTQDVKNLSVALGTNLNAAMAQAVITANGGQKIFTNFASAVLKTGLNSKDTRDSAQKLAQSLLNLTGNTADAHNQFLAFAQQALHLTHDQAENLWKSVAGKLNPTLNDAAGWASKGKDEFEKFAGAGGKGGLGLTSKESDILWGKLSKNGLGGVLADLANSKAPNARAEFEKLAGDKSHGLGLTRDQADKLWSKLHGDLGAELASLTGAQGSVPASKKAFEDWAGAGGKSGLGLTTKQADALWTMLGGSGKGGLKQAIDNLPAHKQITINADTTQANKNVDALQQRLDKVSQQVTGRLGIPIGPATFKQAGGLITHGTGPTADDVHLMASRGEYVMRAAAVSHYGTHVMDALNAGALHPGLIGHAAGRRAAGGLASPGPGYAGGGSVGYAFAAGGPVGMQRGGAVPGGGASMSSLAGAIQQLSDKLQALFTQKIPGWFSGFSSQGKTAFDKTGIALQTQLTSNLQELFTGKMPGWWNNRVAGDGKTAWTKAAAGQQTQYANQLSALFTKTIPGYWDQHVAQDGKTAWTDAATSQQAQYGSPTNTLFTKTIPGYWNDHVTGDGKTAFTRSNSNMQNIFANPLGALFTVKVPNWLTGFVSGAKTAFQVSQGNFSSLMATPIGKSIASWSGDIANAFKTGWNSVAGLFNNNVINWINNNILKHLPGGLSIAHIPTFAQGGLVHMGSGPTADDVHALLSKGEVVVPTRLVQAGAVDHLRGILPGFATGGLVHGPSGYVGDIDAGIDPAHRKKYPLFQGGGLVGAMPGGNPYRNPIGRGAGPARIDMGVDYTGAFDIFALGSGNIRNLYNSGWPGGTYMTLQLDQGPYKNQLWYMAENIAPTVQIGQHVAAGQKVGHARGSYPFTEFGWSANTTGRTMAAASGQAARGQAAGDPGRYSTAWGVAASNLIASLGGPAGILTPGGISGSSTIFGKVIQGIAGFLMQSWQSVLGLLDSAGSGVGKLVAPLGKFLGGGPKELLGLAKKGAQAIFNAVWEHAVKPILARMPLGTMPGAFAGGLALALKNGIGKFMGAKDSAAQKQASNLSFSGTPGHGNVPANAAAIAGFLASHGATRNAIAGILGNIQQESGGNPMAGSNPPGRGLIQILGDPGGTLAEELVRTLAYINANGSIADINAHANSPAEAALYFGQKYERPNAAAANYPNRIASANASYAAGYNKGGRVRAFADGGIIPEPVVGKGLTTGLSYVFGEKGPETVIPGMAAGGIAGYQQALAADQGAEGRAYNAFRAAATSSLAHARPGSYVSSHRKSILSEMVTLAKRQASEVAAYKAVADAHLTAAEITHLISTLKSEITTSKDIALSHLPGGSLAALRSALGKMETRTSQEPSLPVSAGGTVGTVAFPAWPQHGGPVRALQDWWGYATARQAKIKQVYAGLAAAFKHDLAHPSAWLKTHETTVKNELATLAKKQNTEQSAYNALGRPGSGIFPTKAAKDHFLATINSEAVTVKDKDLVRVQPGWMKNLWVALGWQAQLAGTGIGDPTKPATTFAAPALPKRGTPDYITLASIYGWYDRGGILPPGLTLAYNGTGRNEVVSPVPPGGIIGPGGMTAGEMQVINRLDRLISLAASSPAALSQALNGMAGRSSSRGYYGSVR